jgi:type IV pilus assembly protein PilV
MNFTPRARRSRGFTLIELLVALVILSVGLLGVAKLSLGTVQSNDSALMRSQATALVQQVVDDMRANQPQAAAGAYTIGLGAFATPAPACYAAACGAASVVTYDLAKWKALLGSALPAGDGSITTATETNPLTGGTETTATITVQWDDSVASQTFGGGGSTCPAGGNTKCLTVETLL